MGIIILREVDWVFMVGVCGGLGCRETASGGVGGVLILWWGLLSRKRFLVAVDILDGMVGGCTITWPTPFGRWPCHPTL